MMTAAMSDVGTIIVAIISSVVSLAIVALVIVALLRRRSRDGRVTLSMSWDSHEDRTDGDGPVSDQS